MSELRLHKDLYGLTALRAVLADFEDFGTFDVRKEGDYTVVEIQDPDPDFADVLENEIANLALAETVDRKRS